MTHSAKIKRKAVHARCQRVALLAHHFATKGYGHGPLWSAREASQTIQYILSECGGLPGLQRRRHNARQHSVFFFTREKLPPSAKQVSLQDSEIGATTHPQG